MRPSPLAGIACGGAAALIWAGQASVSAHGVRGSFTALDIAALRVAVAGTIILLLFAGRIWRTMRKLGPLRSAALALGGGVPYPVLSISGLEFSTIAHSAAILSGCVPLIAAGLSWLLIGQRISRGWAIGFGLIIPGLLCVIQPFESPAAPNYLLGDLLFLAAAAGFAAFTVLARYWAVGALEATGVATVLSLAYLPLFLLFLAPADLEASVSEIALQAFYQGLLAAVVAIYVFLKAAEILGPERSAVFMASVPGMAVLIGVVALNEIPGTVELAGLALLTGGIFLCLTR